MLESWKNAALLRKTGQQEPWEESRATVREGKRRIGAVGGATLTSMTSVWPCLVQKACGGVVKLTATKLLGFRSRDGGSRSLQAERDVRAHTHTHTLSSRSCQANIAAAVTLTQTELQHRLVGVLTISWNPKRRKKEVGVKLLLLQSSDYIDMVIQWCQTKIYSGPIKKKKKKNYKLRVRLVN